MLRQEVCVHVCDAEGIQSTARILQLVVLAEDKNGSKLNIRCRRTREGEEAETGENSKKQLTHQGRQQRPAI